MIKILHSTLFMKSGVEIMMNERYLDFLHFALHRTTEDAMLFEEYARECENTFSRRFLFFLASRKREHYVLIANTGSTVFDPTDSKRSTNGTKRQTLKEEVPDLANRDLKEMTSLLRNRAEKDLHLYLSLAALEEDRETKRLLVDLSRMAKIFINDISVGYERFKDEKVDSLKRYPKIPAAHRPLQTGVYSR